MQQLKRIVSTATKQHGLQMEQERKIVENLGRSEEWFCQTFKKLRDVCGPALHNIDFKDYQQLHTVIRKPSDCDALLKG